MPENCFTLLVIELTRISSHPDAKGQAECRQTQTTGLHWRNRHSVKLYATANRNQSPISSFQTQNLNHHAALLTMASTKVVNSEPERKALGGAPKASKKPLWLCVIHCLTFLLYVEFTNSSPLQRSSPGWSWFPSHQTWPLAWLRLFSMSQWIPRSSRTWHSHAYEKQLTAKTYPWLEMFSSCIQTDPRLKTSSRCFQRLTSKLKNIFLENTSLLTFS